MTKIGIVASSGGTTCAYSAGASLALKEHFGFRTPKLMIGCSGSAGTLAYFTSGQFRSFQRIWEELLPTDKFIHKRFLYRYLDIDYFVDEILKTKEPLDVYEIKKSPIDFFIAATDAVTGAARYFSNREKVDFFEVIRASCAVPFFYDKKIHVQNSRYLDGALAAPMYTNIAKAKSMGAEKVIAIDNANSSKVNGRWGLDLYSFLIGKGLSQAIKKAYKQEVEYINRYKTDSSVIVISPSKKLQAGWLDINPKHIKKTFDLGYRDMVEKEEINKLFAPVQ